MMGGARARGPRPTVGGLIADALRACRRAPLPLAGLTLSAWLPAYLIRERFPFAPNAGPRWIWFLVLGLVPVASRAFAAGVVAPAALDAARGRPFGGAETLLRTARRLPDLLVLAVLVGAGVQLLELPLELALARPGIFRTEGALMLARLVTRLAQLALWVWLLVAAPACVVEGAGPLRALARSVRLVRVAWWRVLGLMVLYALFATSLTWGVEAVATSLLGGIPGPVAVAVALLLLGLQGVLAAVCHGRLRRYHEGPAPDELESVFE